MAKEWTNINFVNQQHHMKRKGFKLIWHKHYENPETHHHSAL
jgi:hypothetical protein